MSGIAKGPNWPKDLAKHLTESDGEGLLLIIDGLDEFTRKVPFGKTFLCVCVIDTPVSDKVNSYPHESTRGLD